MMVVNKIVSTFVSTMIYHQGIVSSPSTFRTSSKLPFTSPGLLLSPSLNCIGHSVNPKPAHFNEYASMHRILRVAFDLVDRLKQPTKKKLHHDHCQFLWTIKTVQKLSSEPPKKKLPITKGDGKNGAMDLVRFAVDDVTITDETFYDNNRPLDRFDLYSTPVVDGCWQRTRALMFWPQILNNHLPPKKSQTHSKCHSQCPNRLKRSWSLFATTFALFYAMRKDLWR